MRPYLKRMILVISMTAALCLTIPVFLSSDASAATYSGVAGDDIIWEIDTDTDTVTFTGTGRMWDGAMSAPLLVSVSHLVIGEGITSVGASMFNSTFGSGLMYAQLPSTLERIEKEAFCGTMIINISIPENTTFIHPEAFRKTDNLRSITVDGNNPAYRSVSGVLFTKDMMEIIRYPSAMAGSSYTIPYGVRSIGSYAFESCVFRELIIPDTTDYISNWAIYGCESMLSITIPDSVIYMGYGSVAFCSRMGVITVGDGMASVTVDMIPNLLTSVRTLNLGKNVSYVDKEVGMSIGLQKITVDPANPYITAINGVLYNKGVTEVLIIPGAMTGKYVMPNTVRYIGSGVFQHASVTSVTLSESLEAIGSQAFYKNSKISSIKIPKSVKSIGDRAFADCTNLVMVYFEAVSPPSIGANAFNTNSTKNPEIRVYSSMEPGFLDNYAGSTRVAYYDSDTAANETEGVTENPVYAVGIAAAAMAGLVFAEIFVSRKQRL